MTQPRFNLKCGKSPQLLAFPRFLLAEAGQGWSEDWLPEAAFAALPRPRPRDAEVLYFAPPLLEDRRAGAEVNTLPAIVLYLLDTFDLPGERVTVMRIVGDALELFAQVDRAKIETQTRNGKAWWRFKYFELKAWMRLHEALLGAQREWHSEAVLLSAIWVPLCDFFPNLWAMLEAEATQLHAVVTEIGARLEAHRELGDPQKRAYADPFRDASLRKMDAEADPPPDPIHDFFGPDWDA